MEGPDNQLELGEWQGFGIGQGVYQGGPVAIGSRVEGNVVISRLFEEGVVRQRQSVVGRLLLGPLELMSEVVKRSRLDTRGLLHRNRQVVGQGIGRRGRRRRVRRGRVVAGSRGRGRVHHNRSTDSSRVFMCLNCSPLYPKGIEVILSSSIARFSSIQESANFFCSK